MSTKSMSYDHPTYTAVDNDSTSCSGNAGATTKFVAWSGLILKSVTLRPTTANGSSDVTSLITVVGTSTTTTALATYGSGAVTFTNVALTSTASNTLNQGDLYYVVKGTDTAGVISVAIERLVTPGANVTV